MRIGGECDGESVAVNPGDDKGRGGAEHETYYDTGRGKQACLHQVDGEHAPASCAERLEGRDHLALLRHVAADGVADADAAKEQRSQPDQAHELAEAVGLAPDRGRRVGPVVDVEAALREFSREERTCRLELAPVVAALVRKLQAVDPADQA